MISCRLTKNYGGFTIRGTYDDFDTLYNSISYYLRDDDFENPNRETMSNYVYGFLYELRHAYQGDREIVTEENLISEELLEYKNISKNLTHSILFEFTYSVPDFIMFVVLLNFFRDEIVLAENSPEDEDDYQIEYNHIQFFVSIVLDSLKDLLSKQKFLDAKYILSITNTDEKEFIPIIYTTQIVSYLRSTKTERKKMLFDLINVFSSPKRAFEDEDYKNLVKKLKSEAKKQNCSVYDLCIDYPEEIKW